MLYRFDGNRNRGGNMIFIPNDIPGRLLTKQNFGNDIESLFIELKFRKVKWLFWNMSPTISKRLILFQKFRQGP